MPPVSRVFEVLSNTSLEPRLAGLLEDAILAPRKKEAMRKAVIYRKKFIAD